MGSITYDFLADSLFLNKSTLDSGFKNETSERIERELIDYRKHCIDHLDELVTEVNSTSSSLSVFSSTDNTPLDILKQTALYLDQYVIADPLFRFTNLETENETAMNRLIGFGERGVNRESLTRAAAYLKDITPMVAGNFVKIFPTSYHFEPPKQIPFNIPNDYYNNILPKDLLKFFYEKAIVTPLEKKGDEGWTILDNQPLIPCRAISVDFESIWYRNGIIYFLHEMEVTNYDKESNRLSYRQYLPEYPPEESHFNAWVRQSVNASAKAYFDKLFGEVYISSKLNSSYICENNFANELLSKNLKPQDSIKSFTVNQLLNVELPFLEQIDTTKLMEIREADAEVFTNFRIELEKQFRELRTITDEAQLKAKAENVFHELNDVQVQKIRMKMGHLNKQVLINSALAVGGLAGTIASGGISLLSTAVAAAKGYKDYKDYLQSVRENPSYLLWKVQK